MTEAEWLACTDPTPMLELLRGQASVRKKRLLVVGLCRHAWDLLSQWGQKTVEVAERFADGQATDQELEEARWTADSNSVEEDGMHQQAELDRCLPRSPQGDELFLRELDYRRVRLHAAMLVHTSTFPDEWLGPRECSGFELSANAVHLLRCIFGNPFRATPTIDPAWLTSHDSLIPQMAQHIYEQRKFEDLPISQTRCSTPAAPTRTSSTTAAPPAPTPAAAGWWIY